MVLRTRDLWGSQALSSLEHLSQLEPDVITYTSSTKLPWCSMQTSLFFYSGYFYMGYQHGSLQLHSTSKPCSWYFPCHDWDSAVHWDGFGDDLVHYSRATHQELVHTVIEGLIIWRQVYMFRSGIFPRLSFALWCISDTCACHVRMIMVTYAYMFYIALTCVMIDQGIQWEDCCPCHAQTKCNP